MDKITLGAKAHAINIELEQVALRLEEAIIDKMVLAYRAKQLDGLAALFCIAEISAIRRLCKDMDSETRLALEEAMEEADGRTH